MTPLYRNPGIWTRTIAYLAVIVAAFLWGIFELWRGAYAEGSDASGGALFGVLFIGGSIYATWQIYSEWRDTIVSLDRDTDGTLVASRWSLTGPKKISGAFSNWRFHVAIVKRGMPLYFIYADHPALTRPLRFDLRKDVDVTGLRTVAPDAIAEYEAKTQSAASVS
jgi:hypothetical protein